ncbi:MAG: hypothetical protein J0L84_02750, partial [Verrucomicrobia bacterium]|nr:hypothetical protein [Verrucomicrobiota bacterium]
AAEHLDPHWVTHPVVRRIIALHLSLGGEVAALLGHFESDEAARTLVAAAAAERRTIPEPEKQLADAILRLRNAALDREIVQLTARVAEPGIGEAEHLRVLSELQRCRRQKREGLTPLDDPKPPPGAA